MKPCVSIWLATMHLLLAVPLLFAGGNGSLRGVDAIAREVLDHNPELESARLKWEALKERPAIAGSLPDPMLTYGYFIQNVETRVGAQNQKVGLAQKIPFPGKLSLAARKARQEAMQAFWQYQTLARELIMRARIAYYDLYLVEQTRQILRLQLDLYKQTIESARSKYEAGKVAQQDLLKAQLAHAEIEKRLLDLEEQRATAEARLNALRNAPDGAPIPATEGLKLPATPDLHRAMALAVQYRQELKEARVTIQRNETALALTKKERWPDFTFAIDYTQVNENIFAMPPDNGQDAVVASVGVNLPIWFGKLNAQEREAAKILAASRAAAGNRVKTVEADVREAWFKATTARDQLELFRQNLLPQAGQTYEASVAGYEAGKVSFIELFDAERSLLNFRLGLVTSETSLAKALATLERAIGMDLREAQKASIARKEGSK